MYLGRKLIPVFCVLLSLEWQLASKKVGITPIKKSAFYSGFGFDK